MGPWSFSQILGFRTADQNIVLDGTHDHVCHVFQCQTRILPDLPGVFGGSVAYMIQMVVVYLGLGVIVQNSTIVFNTIKWEGVVYLVALGFRNWRQSVRDMEMPHTDLPVSPVRLFSLGCATGMSNPKSVLVLTVLFPQFIQPDHYTAHFAILAASFSVIQGSSALAYALFGARVFKWLRQKT